MYQDLYQNALTCNPQGAWNLFYNYLKKKKGTQQLGQGPTVNAKIRILTQPCPTLKPFSSTFCHTLDVQRHLAAEG